MKILHKGAIGKSSSTYKFSCRVCGSKMQAKEYELRPFGFKKNTNGSPQNSYAFTCPVCNCRRIVYANKMKRVMTIRERIDKLLTDIVRDVERRASK